MRRPERDDAGHEALGPGREFDVIRDLLARWSGIAHGIGDDGAVLDVPAGSHLVASVDTSLEGVHFRRDWLTLREIGYRATASALSDLAAMAAQPLAMLLALSLPADRLDDAAALGDGVGDAARDSGCAIVGGDTTQAPQLALSVTVLGYAVAPVRRSGARAGDAVYVTGRLGAAGAALVWLERGETPPAPLRERYAHPVPRIAEARWLAARGASAMIDISDGLASELRHLAAASGVGIAVELERVPLAGDLPPAAAAVSGEEYELLLTAPHELDAAAFTRAFNLPLTRIGQVTDAAGGVVSITHRGTRVDLGAGYDHFSR
jgi:thiamine-monophosphate kinase